MRLYVVAEKQHRIRRGGGEGKGGGGEEGGGVGGGKVCRGFFIVLVCL